MAAGTHYSPAQVDAALLALATTGSGRLAAQQVDVPERTIQDWRHRYAQRYQELADKHQRQIEDVIVQQARDTAIMAGDIERQVLERLSTQVDSLDAKDAAATVRNLSTAKGINVDKLLTLTGRPSQVTEHRSTDDLMRKLESLKVKAIDATAEEIPTPTEGPTSRLIAQACETNTREG